MKTVKDILVNHSNNEIGPQLFKFIWPDREWTNKTEERMNKFLDDLKELKVVNNSKNNIIFIQKVLDDIVDNSDWTYDVFSLSKSDIKKIKPMKITEKDCLIASSELNSKIYEDFWKHNEVSSGESLSFVRWENLLNYYISDYSIERFGEINCLLIILNEMTFYGWDQILIEKEKQKLIETINNLKLTSKTSESLDLSSFKEPSEDELRETEKSIIFSSMNYIMEYSREIEYLQKELN